MMISCIILTHADLGSGLKNALEGIMGKQESFSVISNTGMGKERMILALRKEIEEHHTAGGVVIFVDMIGSSCWYTAQRVVSSFRSDPGTKPENRPKVAIVTGVNLPMLVKFFSSRESLSFDRLVPQIQKEGEKGIVAES